LDAWQRPITFLEDPDLIEKAVGIDSTGRLQTVWQVKWLDVSTVAGIVCSTPDEDIPPWVTLRQPPGSRLTTRGLQSSPSGPCCLTSASGFTGLENQLYRIEIHQTGSALASGVALPIDVAAVPPNTATFKWSKDNASVTTSVLDIQNGGKDLTVQSTGKD